MRHFEIISESAEEDRAIISLAAAISERIKDLDEPEPEEFTDYDEYDPDADLDISPDLEDEPIVLGQIGDLFDTPLEILNPITIELQSSYGMNERYHRDSGGEGTKDPKTSNYLGLWYPENSTIVLNREYIGSNSIRSTITHELRHALDDYKSDFKAGDSTRYSTPKNPAYRDVEDHPTLGNVGYLARPEEINARFAQVLNDMVPVVGRAAKLGQAEADKLISSSLLRFMELRKIYNLFPEKEASKDFKRLMSRAMVFISKEFEHLRSLSNERD